MSDSQPRETFVRSIRKHKPATSKEAREAAAREAARERRVAMQRRARRKSWEFSGRLLVGVISGAIFGVVVGILAYMYFLLRFGNTEQGMTAGGCIIWGGIGAVAAVLFYMFLAFADRAGKRKSRRPRG